MSSSLTPTSASHGRTTFSSSLVELSMLMSVRRPLRRSTISVSCLTRSSSAFLALPSESQPMRFWRLFLSSVLGGSMPGVGGGRR